MDSRNLASLPYEAASRFENTECLGTGMSLAASYITGMRNNNGTLPLDCVVPLKKLVEEIGEMMTFMVDYFLHDNRSNVSSIHMHTSLSNHFLRRTSSLAPWLSQH